MAKTTKGANRRITKAMIQWAEEQGACDEALKEIRKSPTFGELFGPDNPAGAGYQVWVIQELLGSAEWPQAWAVTWPGSREEFVEFMRIIDQWEIVDA